MKRLFLIIGGLAVLLIGIAYASNANITLGTGVIEEIPAQNPTAKAQPTQATSNVSFTMDDIAKTGKPQFLDAYAPWCPACQANEPTIRSLRKQFKDRVDFLFLNVDNPGVLDAIAPYTLTGMTQYVLISPDGEIIQKWFGSVSEEDIAELIDTYLEGI